MCVVYDDSGVTAKVISELYGNFVLLRLSTKGKNRLSFAGDLVTDTDSGSLFDFH